MTNGANHPGKIHRGDLDQWTFTATPNDAISLSIGADPRGGGPGIQSMDSPARARRRDLGPFLGPLIAPAEINVTAPLTGTYTVVVASSTVATGIGEYLLTLAQDTGHVRRARGR